MDWFLFCGCMGILRGTAVGRAVPSSHTPPAQGSVKGEETSPGLWLHRVGAASTELAPPFFPAQAEVRF